MKSTVEQLSTAREASARLASLGTPERARVNLSFFKTGEGEYGHGDRFVGVTTPDLRRVAAMCRDLPEHETLELLWSPIHEERLLALLLFVRRYERGDEEDRRGVYARYLANTGCVNNWDLVDASAPGIVGAHLISRSRRPLLRLAASADLWERRIAIVATFAFIRRGEFDDTLAVTERLMGDRHDLIHKACGWMLREVGKRDEPLLESYLAERYGTMPRTMLRYAIERFPEARRRAYLRGAI